MKPETKTIAMIKNLHFTRSLTRSLAIAALAIFMFLPGKGWGQLSITGVGSGNTYTQNFDAFAGTLVTLPVNWTWTWSDYTPGGYYNRTGGAYLNSNSTYGLRESASPGTDIAFGGKIDGNTYYLALSATNNTGSAISGFTITWNVEQYSAFTNATPVDFSYRLNGGSYITTGITGTTLTTASTLVTAANLASITTTARSITITGINLANAGTVDFRLSMGNGTANNAHIGVDDFTVYAIAASSNSTASDIIRNATFSEPTNITYGGYQSTDIQNDVNSLEIAKFDIRDGGVTTDGDALGTDLTALTFSLSNWANVRRLALYDGTTEISEVAVSSGTVAFTGLTGLSAADGASKTFTVRASFNTSVTDNQQLQLTVTAATAAAAGSTFASADAGGSQSLMTGGVANKIVVTATKLLFVQQPTATVINAAMTPNPSVKAVDANNNTDLDYSTAVTVVSTGTLTGSPVSGSWASNLASFAGLTHTATGTGLTLTASSAGITDAVSSTFDIAAACVTNPTITTTVTPNTITTTTASSGGQTLTVDAGCTITNKGVCWGINSEPTIAGTKTDNGTGTADFTSSITGLTAGTLFYIRAYATNSFGTTYGDEKTFRTLSLEPTAHPTSFTTATVTSNSALTLNFSAASTITNGAGYIILQRTAAAPTGVPTDGNGYSVGATIGDATVAAIINSTSAVNTTISGLSGNTQYYFSIIALNWDGSNAATYNYRTSATIKTTNATTSKIEPTNQVTNFVVGGVTTSSIPLNWTAAVAGSQLPDGYLIKLSAAPNAVVDPADGTDPTNVTAVTGGLANKETTPGSASSATSFTSMSPGTMYNYKIYSYTNTGANINFNTTSAPGLNHATLPNAVTPVALTGSGATTATITWTAGTGYSSANNSTLVFVKATSSVTAGTPSNAPSFYTANTVFGTGTAYQNDAAAYCVFNGDGTSVSISGLNANTTYHVLFLTVVDAINSNSTYSYSASATTSGTTLSVPATLPYTQDFESTTPEWTLATVGTNKWAIGSATNNGGSKALYISNNSGTSNAYTITSTQAGTDASVRVDLTGITAASLTFDWKSNGESTFDYGEVYINSGASDVLISGIEEFEATTTFASKQISLTPYVGGIVTIKFRWVNDASAGTNPPFAVDNISVTAGDLATLTTSSATSITVNGASTGGNVTNDGGSTVTRGVCYGTSTNPTIVGSKTTDGTGIGSFTSTLTGLTDNTLYYVRAYATNSTGTAYGNEISFTTSSVAAPNATLATGITSTSFDANWEAVTGAANGYLLDVSTSATFGTTNPVTLDEGFESGLSSSGYVSTTLGLASGSWTFVDGGLRNPDNNSGTYSCQLKATTGTATLPILDNIGTLTFYAKAPSGTSSLVIKKIVNSVTTVIDTKTITSSWLQYTVNVGDASSDIQMLFANGANYVLIDDVSVGYTALIPSFVFGYDAKPISGQSTATSSVTGLTASTPYYYRVRSVGVNSTSANSNVITVTTDSKPTTYAMTGGGAYCAGGLGVAVGLSDSELGVDYTLIKDGTPTATVIVGDGNAISFGVQLFGTYTASGAANGVVTTIDGTTAMSGTAVVSATALVTPTFAQLGPYCVGDTPGTLPLTSINGINGTWNEAISTASAGSVVYTFTPTAGQCATTATMTVVVNATPGAPTVSVTQPTCLLANGSVSITSLTAGLTFSFNGGTYTADASPYTVAANAVYSITAKNGSGCVSEAATGTMGAQPAGPSASILLDNDVAYENNPYTFDATASGGTILWTWESLSGDLSSSIFPDPADAEDLVFTPVGSGSIKFTLTVTSATGCGSSTDHITLWILGTNPIIWSGNINETQWDNPGNWAQGIIPTSALNVKIPANATRFPDIATTGATCHNIQVENGASLIDNGNLSITGQITVEHPSISAGRWHFISSPVSGVLSGMFTGDYLYEYATGGTYTPILSTSKSLDAMVGYALYPKTNPYTSAYVGGLNPTSNSFTVSGAGSGDQAGWNLVGNPYTSAINWDATSGWTKPAVVDNATYIVNATSSSWRSYVGGVESNGGSQYIAPTQGFFVHATGAGTLAMTNDVQVHNPVTFSKKSEAAVTNLVRLEVSGNEFRDEAVVRFTTEATPEFDGNFDALKLYGYVTEAAQLYTLGSIPLAINSLPETGQVPVGIKVGTNGSYTIAATEITDMPYVTLEDNETGIYTNLSDEPYTFEAVAGTFDQRFILHFSMLSVEETKKVSATVYSYQQTVHINMKDQVKGDIYIYNIAGQLVSTKRAAQGMNEIKLPNVGNYIVKVITKDNTVVRKVFIQ